MPNRITSGQAVSQLPWLPVQGRRAVSAARRPVFCAHLFVRFTPSFSASACTLTRSSPARRNVWHSRIVRKSLSADAVNSRKAARRIRFFAWFTCINIPLFDATRVMSCVASVVLSDCQMNLFPTPSHVIRIDRRMIDFDDNR